MMTIVEFCTIATVSEGDQIDTRWGNDRITLRIRKIIRPAPDRFTQVVARAEIERIQLDYYREDDND